MQYTTDNRPGTARGAGPWKFLAVWLAMLAVSVANGALREFTYGTCVDELAAHQISTAIGIVALGAVIGLFARVSPFSSAGEAVCVGLFWAALTVAFEFVFFHYIGGHSWAALLSNYNVLQGRVWVFIIAWVAMAPYIAFRLNKRRRKGA
ncbi:MAG: hypothetical protein QMB52_06990 [Propionivibrio sp.]